MGLVGNLLLVRSEKIMDVIDQIKEILRLMPYVKFGVVQFILLFFYGSLGAWAFAPLIIFLFYFGSLLSMRLIIDIIDLRT